MTSMISTDVLIIGGGPAGCACALYTARSALKTIILDKNSAVGALAITRKIANYPGVDSETAGSDLLDTMREQAVSYGAEYQQTQVYGIELSGDQKKVYTPDGTYVAKTLVLATGAMGKSVVLPGEQEFLGRGVSYCATCDAAFYKQQEVLVYGSNKEAIDEAHVLTKFASTVHFVTSQKPQAKSGAEQLLNKANVKHWERTRLLSIEGNDEEVTKANLEKTGEKGLVELDVCGVFIYSSGSQPITDYLHGQIPLTKEGGVKVNTDMKTEVDGIWAIGDIRNTPFKQAVVACADGCIAAMSIDKYLNQRKDFRVDWVHR